MCAPSIISRPSPPSPAPAPSSTLRTGSTDASVGRVGKTLRQALEEEIGKERYKNLGDPVKLADQVADDGGKLQRLKVIYNLYLIRAEADFRKEANQFFFDDNNKLTLTKAIQNTKKNKLELGKPRTDSDVNTNKLQPIYNFGNNR